MAKAPTPRQVSEWVRRGIITEAQGRALRGRSSGLELEGAPREPWDLKSMAKSAARLGPKPAWREALPALAGLGWAVLAAIPLVAADTLLARQPGAEPGDVLEWAPWAAAAAFLAGGLLRPRWTLPGLAACMGLLTLAPLLDAAPPTQAYAIPLVAHAALFAVGLPPAARSAIGLAGLGAVWAAATAFLADSDYLTLGGLALLGVYLLALWFSVPFASGWRRIPYLAHLAAGLAGILLLLGGLVAAAVRGQVIFSRAEAQANPASLLTSLLVLAAVVAYPVLVVRLWGSARSREYQLRPKAFLRGGRGPLPTA